MKYVLSLRHLLKLSHYVINSYFIIVEFYTYLKVNYNLDLNFLNNFFFQIGKAKGERGHKTIEEYEEKGDNG